MMQKSKWRVIKQIPTPVTTDGCYPTITTRQSAVGGGNLYSVGHYPMGGAIVIGEWIDDQDDFR